MLPIKNISSVSLKDPRNGKLKLRKGTAFSVVPIQIGQKHLLFEILSESHTYLIPKYKGWEFLVDRLENNKWVSIFKYPIGKRFEPGMYRLPSDWV
jgi:hypothetical protein